ncbi:hypothetical protein K474DRAFT_1668042 [Panus rudis PR-1116 ss-1]|nr:hypothetical protein K474DRAFT_1668042 [Panus rudis PR-1116 ss-1]
MLSALPQAQDGSDTFGTPNLLMGGPTTLGTLSSHADASMEDTENFRAEPLLSENIPRTFEAVEKSEFGTASLLEDSFASNGLLSGSMAGSPKSIETRMEIESEGFGSATLLNDDSFATNGILSSSTAITESQTFVQYSLGQSQDEELPHPRDVFRRDLSSTKINKVSTSRSTIQIQRASVKATTFDGKSVFIRRKVKNIDIAANASASSSRAEKIGNLLDVPIHRLLENLSRETAVRLDASERAAAAISTQTSATAKSSGKKPSDDALWVDRYRPQRYIDLVGDDRVHREVMAWVKEWDWCVFGNKKGKAAAKKRLRDEENQDEYRRPKEKILLISGPPGLGKTTLAHVVAKHAGYSVFEINASDSRSANIVDDRIRPALESGSTIGSKKPTLLVIDEIDGATGGSENNFGFIHKLIQLIQERPRRKGRKDKEKNHVLPILRPIICICNDLYASSLTKLRPHARIIRMNRPNDVHLVRRLRTICEEEGMKVESRALSTLVGVAQGDMRGCLNTLQVIKSRSGEVTEAVVRKATVGMKEADTSQTAVLNDLFTPMSKKRLKELGLTEEQESRYVSRLCREVETSGAMDKIAIGCFEHYANLRRHDGNFSRYLKANEWLSSYDLLGGEMRTEREYSAMQYLPYLLVPFYPLFNERGAPKVERPKQDWEHFTQMKTNEEIYQSLAKGCLTAAARLGGAYRDFANDNLLRLEFAPFINRIISPPLRPINSQVIKPDERLLLNRLVDIMVALELRFVLEKNEDGQNMLRLDPPIDVFVTYDGKRASDIALSRFATRQLVATEIDAKWVNVNSTEASTSSNKAAHNFFGAAKNNEANVGSEGKLMSADRAGPTLINKRAREEEIVEKVPTDFFGRPIVKPHSSAKPASKKAKVEKPYKVAYKFNEGNSAAVRKPVKVAAFL